MLSSLLHLVGLRPRVYYTLTNFRGGGGKALLPPLNTPMRRTCVRTLPPPKKCGKLYNLVNLEKNIYTTFLRFMISTNCNF